MNKKLILVVIWISLLSLAQAQPMPPSLPTNTKTVRPTNLPIRVNCPVCKPKTNLIIEFYAPKVSSNHYTNCALFYYTNLQQPLNTGKWIGSYPNEGQRITYMFHPTNNQGFFRVCNQYSP